MKDKNNIKIFFYIFIFITFASQILAQENKDNESKSPSEARPPVKGLPFELYLISSKRICDDKECIHCFSGDIDQAKKIIDLGFYMGIGGVVTFKNAGLDKRFKLKSLI